jgi:hypothetical protein
MPLEPNEPTIAADGVGIHFLSTGRDITVHWGEIEAICVLREEPPEGTAYLRFFVDLFGGVDFQFTSADAGYEQVTADMAKHLIGFSRVRAESVGSWKTEHDIPVVWRRDVSIQPFELRPPPVIPAPSSPEAAHVRKVWKAAGCPGPWDSFWLQMFERLNIGPDGE